MATICDAVWFNGATAVVIFSVSLLLRVVVVAFARRRRFAPVSSFLPPHLERKNKKLGKK